MDVEIVRISSRGQFVLPMSMRKKLRMNKGEKVMVVEDGGTMVLRPVKDMKLDIDDEVYMMQRAARAWGEIEKGRFKRMPKKQFLKELETW